MYAVANCLADILRTVGADDFGDMVDDVAAEPVHEGIPASVVVKSHQTSSQGDTSPRTVQRVEGRVGSGIDVRTNDLLRDTTRNITYAVRSATQDNGTGQTPDLVLELDRLT